jgi:hypothetical protein
MATAEVHAACSDYSSPWDDACEWITDARDYAKQTWEKVSAHTVNTWNAVKTTSEKTLGTIAEETQGTVNTIDTTLKQMTTFAETTTDEVLTRLEIAAHQVKFQVQNEHDGLMDFIGDSANGCADEPCEAFRDELLDLVLQMESISNTLITFPGTGRAFVGSVNPSPFPPVNFRLLHDTIDILPGVSLYPVYRVFELLDDAAPGDVTLLEALLVALYQSEMRFQQFQDIVKAPAIHEYVSTQPAAMGSMSIQQVSGRLVSKLDYEEDERETLCTWMRKRDDLAQNATNRQALEAALPYLQGIGMPVKYIGYSALAISHAIEAHVAAGLSFGGEAQLHIKHNWIRFFFTGLTAVGDLALDTASVVGGNLLSCDTQLIRTSQKKIRQSQQYMMCILENQQGGARAVKDCKKDFPPGD